jgi:hypothetical protein
LGKTIENNRMPTWTVAHGLGEWGIQEDDWRERLRSENLKLNV